MLIDPARDNLKRFGKARVGQDEVEHSRPVKGPAIACVDSHRGTQFDTCQRTSVYSSCDRYAVEVDLGFRDKDQLLGRDTYTNVWHPRLVVNVSGSSRTRV